MSELKGEQLQMFQVGKALKGGDIPKTRGWSHKNRLICIAIRKVYVEGQLMSPNAVANQLQKKGMLQYVGGHSYLTKCWEAAE